MGCSVKPRLYVATVVTNADYDGATSPADVGLFNPISDVLATQNFSAARLTVELLSRSSTNIQLAAGVRQSNNGRDWIEYWNVVNFSVSNWTTVDDWAAGWLYVPYLNIGEVARYYQFGLYARLASEPTPPTTRQTASVRFQLNFKNSPMDIT